MVKPLHFKGDKKPAKKRKRENKEEDRGDEEAVRPFPGASGSGSKPSKELVETGATTVAKKEKVAAATQSEELDADDGWVASDSLEDVKGPVIFGFTSTPPTCIACDANGKVFASELKDVEGDDLAGTAEPHDVRQVWIATRIPSTPRFNLKGHHGRYLGCDKFGILSATKEAISPEEEFILIKTETGWAIQTCRDKFLRAEEKSLTASAAAAAGGGSAAVEIRGDAEVIGFGETWCVKGQRRFKTKSKKEREKAEDKISRRELEKLAGMQLDDDQVRKLKRARREGNLQSALLDIRQKKKHDRFAY